MGVGGGWVWVGSVCVCVLCGGCGCRGWVCVGSVCVCVGSVWFYTFFYLFIFFFGKYLRKRIFFNKTKNKNLFLFIFDRAKIKRVNTTGCLL